MATRKPRIPLHSAFMTPTLPRAATSVGPKGYDRQGAVRALASGPVATLKSPTNAAAPTAAPAAAPAPAPPAPAPYDELAGLPDYIRQDIGAFDRQTGAQQDRITAAYQALADQSRLDADAAARRQGALAGLAGMGYTPTPAGLPSAISSLPATLGNNAVTRAGTAGGLETDWYGKLPTLALMAGATQREGYLADRDATRRSTIFNARQEQEKAAAEAAGDQADREFDLTKILTQGQVDAGLLQSRLTAEDLISRRQVGATLRGQDLDLVGTETSQRGANLRAQITAGTADANRIAGLRREQARLETQIQIARERNDTTRATSLASQQARVTSALIAAQARDKPAARRTGRGTPNYASLRSRWTTTVRQLLQGKTTVRDDAQGNPQPVVTQEPALPEAALAQAISAGIDPRDAFQMVVAGGAAKNDRALAGALYNALEAAGRIRDGVDATARRLVLNLTGVDIATEILGNAGV